MTVPRKPRAASKPAAKSVAAKRAAEPAGPTQGYPATRRTKPRGEDFTLERDYADLAGGFNLPVEAIAWSIENNDDDTHTLIATPAAAEA